MSTRTPPSSSPELLPPERGGRFRPGRRRIGAPGGSPAGASDGSPGGSRAGPPGGSPGGSRAWPRPARPRLPAWLAYRLQRVLAPNAAYRRLASWLAGSPLRYRLFTAAERATKSQAFGCRMCGQCTLPVTGYACPMTCPKQLRNGPCGGVGADGSCEVFPGVRCVWVEAYERAQHQGRVADLLLLQRPVDHRRFGESSWVNYWAGDDEGLWAAPGPGGTPGIHQPARPAGPVPGGLR